MKKTAFLAAVLKGIDKANKTTGEKPDASMKFRTRSINGYKNWAGYCPEKNVTIVISYNATTSKPMALATRLMNIYLGAVKK